MSGSRTASRATLVDVLRGRAIDEPDDVGYIFLADGERESARLTWAEVDRSARAIGAELQRRGGGGQRALITYPAEAGPQYLTAFLGCLYGGVTAVPCDAAQGRAGAERLRWIAEDAAPSFVLGSAATNRLVAGDACALDVTEIPDDTAAGWCDPGAGPDTLALLQYTSGSTGTPRGVMVTHGNVMANEAAIAATCEHDGDAAFVGWLPLYHDMGLIANLLQPLYLGSQSILMPPAAFLARPMRWLEAISRYRANTSGGPNFAYDLCVARARPEEVEVLDLSSWRVAFNGAEVIRAATLARFVEAFCRVGFAPETFLPCYGLAEATLIVSGAPRRVPPRTLAADRAALRGGRCVPPATASAPTRTLVSSGRVVVQTTVAIVEPDSGVELAEGSLGEVWISGPGVAVGYWGRGAESTAVFANRLAGADGVFLRTGDVGAVLDGELYVVSRLKDMIVIRGQNHYPEDLENTAERSHPALRPSCGAAFSVDDGRQERLVILYEVHAGVAEPDVRMIADAVRQAVAERHHIEVSAVVLVPRGSVPKTTSGKVRRLACRERYLTGAMTPVGVSVLDEHDRGAEAVSLPDLARVPAGERKAVLTDALLAAVAARVSASAATLDPDAALSAAGLDSLGALELEHRIQDRYRVRLPPLALLGDRSATDLAADLLGRVELSVPPEPVPVREPEPGPTEAPLAPMQRALWFEHELAHGSAYSLVRVLRISGELDDTAMDRAVSRLVERHEALRTRFVERNGEPVQIVTDPAAVPLRREDLSAADEATVDSRLSAVAGQQFALSGAAAPVRFVLLRRSPVEHLLVVAAHHIVVDFWSLVVVLRDLGALYDEEAGGAPAALPPVRGTLISHAARELALSGSVQEQRLWTYWSHRLDGVPVLELPLARKRPPTRGFRGSSQPVRLAAQLTALLRRISREQHTTLFTTVLTAFHVLLSCQTGQRDVVVGTLASGRDQAELADVVGCLVNVVPVRAQLRPGDSFRSLLRRVRDDLLSDLAHARYPFAKLVSRLQPVRSPSRPPLVSALLVLHQEYGPRADGVRAVGLGIDGPQFGSGLQMHSVAVPQPWTHLDLTLNLAEVGGVLQGGFEYDAALFEPATVAALAERFVELLRALVADPDRLLEHIPLPTPAERAAALEAGRGPTRPRPSTECLHDFVLAESSNRPDATAVVAPSADGITGHVSYRALRTWVGRLAGRLAEAGVGPGDTVGVLLGRSPFLPAALLAVLQRGAAYLPLDPADPPARLAWLVADAGIRTVLGDGRTACPAETVLDVTVLDVTDIGQARVPAVAVHPEQTAYVLHTSGSTGRPKGVAVPHRGIVNRLRWMQEEYRLGPGDRVVHKAPTTFDVSLWELFWPLSCGACLVIAPPAAHRDPDLLAEVMRREQVGTAHFVPSLLAVFLAAAPEPLPALRRVVCSGEVLPTRLRDRAHRVLTARLHNLYGPTETSVDVTAWECQPGQDGPVPIGRPIANTVVHVLDGALQPLPPLVRGELYVGGMALAHGYHERPGLTAAAFVPDPLASEAGRRLYRTGDQGRRRTDGVIEYLGRDDHQVKIAGVRIELGEVEDAVHAQPGVRDAVVACHDDGSGPRLVAYVVGDADPTSLRAALRQLLPSALVPMVISLGALPVTASGKLDRGALPAPPSVARPVRVEPRPGAERRIAELWAEVLGVGQIGADDDFFVLGGDSITALRLVGALRHTGVPVTVADLMSGASVTSLARLADDAPAGSADDQPAPFALCPERLRTRMPADVEDVYPMSMAQRAVLFHQMHGSSHEVYVTSVQVRSGFDQPRLRAALAAVLTRHAYLRSSFDLTSSREPHQLVHRRRDTPLTVHDLRDRQPAHQEMILAEWLTVERRRPIEVSAGPLMRCTVHRRCDQTFQLTISSFALDGWCTATVITELLVDYAARRGGQPAQLPAPSIGYSSFVALEQAAMRSTEHRAFWARELAEATPCRLPEQSPAPPDGDPLTRRRTVDVESHLVAELRRIAREQAVPLKSVLLAAHLRVVRLLSAQSTVLTGLEVNGRPEHLDGDRVVGVFNNVAPLRVPVAAGSWADLIQAAAAAERRVLPYRRYPFAQLEREHGVSGLFDTLFVFTHFHLYDRIRDVEGVELLTGQAPDQTYIPLTCHVTVDPLTGALRLMIDYDPARVTDELATAATGYYLRALALLAADPDAAHSAADLLSSNEVRRQLIVGGPSRADSTVHELILRQVAATPDAIAVATGPSQLTYRELGVWSGRLATALRAAGVGPDTLVGLPAGRGPELVASLLAILRAGGAYLPWDPGYPTARLTALLAGVPVVVADGDVATLVPPGCTVVPTDASGPPVPPPPVHPESLAYALPTSGTTGTPKIVGVPHRAVCNYLAWCYQAYGPRPGSRTPVHSSAAFDLTVTSLLAPLCAGGTVELVAPDALGRVLAAGADGLLKITPAHLEAVGHQLRARAAEPAVSCVVVGGEQLSRQHIAQWRHQVVFNEYGPTEATVGCCAHRAASAGGADPVPIGRPIPGTWARVLHDGLPVPIGVAAELHVGGVGLARGYLGRPGLTAERFVPDSFGSGARLYRTGDIARLDDEGLLHFVGRTDRQLKLRGYRVEPAEIERELCLHSAVRQAAVVAAPAGAGRLRLLAYWVPSDGLGAGPDSESPQLAEWLMRRLPAHLVPAEFFRLPALPLTGNGKVDHARLADPASARRASFAELVAGLSDDAAAELLAQARATGRAAE